MYLNLIKNAILIAGPTASGKSCLATRLAARYDGVIINTDSMQIYDGLNILTACPDYEALSIAPHFLYRYVSPHSAYSVGLWLRDVLALASSHVFEKKRPIFTGGTGLYFRALTQGISPMPEIPQEIRSYWRYRLVEDGSIVLHRILEKMDPASALGLDPSDGQRIIRAIEVFEVSGRSILSWRNDPVFSVLDLPTARMFLLQPERSILYSRINSRLKNMLCEKGLAEVSSLIDLNLDNSLPVMKAIGVSELSSAIRGEISLEQAADQMETATRQYTKRQLTWFRNQFGLDWIRFSGVDDVEINSFLD